MVAGSSAAERGHALEQQVAAYFTSHGYQVETNRVLIGRSGGRHEVDVLAEKSDALTSFRIAVECKAWNSPIEKDVVSKLHYVMTDLGLHKGIIISLAGTRSGADTAAGSLGIEVWGPDELRHHMGESVFADVDAPHQAKSGPGRLIDGWPFAADPNCARQLAADAGKGRFGLRSLETLTWFAPLWVPAYLVHLTVAHPSARRLRQHVTSNTVVNVYEALEGQFIGRGAAAPVELPAGDVLMLKPLRRETQIQAALRKAVEGRHHVSAPSAVERHDAHLTGLGLPVPVHSVSVDHTSLVHLPVYAGLLQREQDRLVAINGSTGQISEPLSRLLTGELAYIRASFHR
ncbi:MAG: restriction endonuclease [Dermatophilaceae bacterium]